MKKSEDKGWFCIWGNTDTREWRRKKYERAK